MGMTQLGNQDSPSLEVQELRISLHFARAQDGSWQNVVEVVHTQFSEGSPLIGRLCLIRLIVPHFSYLVDVQVVLRLLFDSVSEGVVPRYILCRPLRVDFPEGPL